jgi:FtsZ-binding cell division protein ZapB
MKKKNSLILDDEFIQYCELNNINDIDKLAKETFARGFSILKYGETPFKISNKEKIIEKEVIKEVPVEKIVEVIVYKDSPIKYETITQEVIREVPVQNDGEIDRLKEENKKLSDELTNIKSSLDKFNRAKYLKNSDLNNLYGE